MHRSCDPVVDDSPSVVLVEPVLAVLVPVSSTASVVVLVPVEDRERGQPPGQMNWSSVMVMLKSSQASSGSVWIGSSSAQASASEITRK